MKQKRGNKRRNISMVKRKEEKKIEKQIIKHTYIQNQ